MSVLIVLLFLLGLSGISAGLCMIAIPYGVIAAGAGLVLLSIILANGYDDNRNSGRKS
jgi:hypothetical protein